MTQTSGQAGTGPVDKARAGAAATGAAAARAGGAATGAASRSRPTTGAPAVPTSDRTDEGQRLPAGLDVLWNGRVRGRTGPKPGLTVDAIVEAAIGIADAEGLPAVSMAKVAAALGFTTMSLYRHVSNKDELLVLMWNASAAGAPTVTGNGWRERLENWSTAQMDLLQRRRWVLQLPLASPPAGPNSLAWVEQAMVALGETPLDERQKLGVVGLISTYVLSEARMASDVAAALGADGLPVDYGQILRIVADDETFPALHRAAWSGELGADTTGTGTWSADAGFRFGLNCILDGVEALIERQDAGRGGSGG